MQIRPLCKSVRFHGRPDPRIAVHIFRPPAPYYHGKFPSCERGKLAQPQERGGVGGGKKRNSEFDSLAGSVTPDSSPANLSNGRNHLLDGTYFCVSFSGEF